MVRHNQYRSDNSWQDARKRMLNQLSWLQKLCIRSFISENAILLYLQNLFHFRLNVLIVPYCFTGWQTRDVANGICWGWIALCYVKQRIVVHVQQELKVWDPHPSKVNLAVCNRRGIHLIHSQAPIADTRARGIVKIPTVDLKNGAVVIGRTIWRQQIFLLGRVHHIFYAPITSLYRSLNCRSEQNMCPCASRFITTDNLSRKPLKCLRPSRLYSELADIVIQWVLYEELPRTAWTPFETFYLDCYNASRSSRSGM